MNLKEAMAFTVFICSMFFYNILPITSTVLLLLSLTWLFRIAKELEKKGEI